MLMWMMSASLASPVEVTTLVEPGVPGDGQCSLSEAIEFVNNGTADGSGCAGKKYPDEITFPGLSGTVTLADDAPSLYPTLGSMTITGPGAGLLTVDLAGHQGFRTPRQGVSVTLRGLTVTGGDTTSQGGALFVDANDVVVVEDSVFTGNTTTTNGGAIAGFGDLTLLRVVVSGNSTTGDAISQGGGVWSNGVLSIRDSAIVGNRSTAQGGGVFVGADGLATITNSTISGNEARQGGGLAVINAFGRDPGPTATVIGATITDNLAADSGGGVVVSGTGGRSNLVVGRTVVAGNTSKAESPDCENADGVGGSITSLGYVLIGTDERCGLAATGPGDVIGTPKAPVAPGLEALDNNAATRPTHRPSEGSPTIDAVPAVDCVDDAGAPLGADQRGFPRPDGAGCEIGAHEIGCGDGVVDGGEECDGGPEYDPTCVDCQLVESPNDTADTADTGTVPLDSGTGPGPIDDTGAEDPDDDRSCGCQGAPNGALLWLPAGLLLLRRRRPGVA